MISSFIFLFPFYSLMKSVNNLFIIIIDIRNLPIDRNRTISLKLLTNTTIRFMRTKNKYFHFSEYVFLFLFFVISNEMTRKKSILIRTNVQVHSSTLIIIPSITNCNA